MKRSAKIITSLCLTLSCMSTNVFAVCIATSTAPCTSADYATTLPTLTPRILCPQVTMGTDTKKLTAGPTEYPIPAKYDHDCQSGISGGGVGWGGAFFIIVIAGAFTPSCPPERPFLNAITEGWGGIYIGFAGGGGAGMTVTCCAMPEDPVMSMESGYKAGSYDHWADKAVGCPSTPPTP